MVLFFGALMFATSTIFVQENWAAMTFAVLVGLLLAFQSTALSPWILSIPAWGVLQLLCGTSIYPQATLYSVIHWMALASVFLVARRHGTDKDTRRTFLDWFVAFAAVEATLCLAQLHTSQGKILWWIPSGYDDFVYGTFPSYNNFSQFAELALPVALVRAFQNRKQALWYILASGMLFAAVIASTSRAGAILVTLELIGVPIVMLASRPLRREDLRQAALVLGAIPLLAAVWTLAAGWDQLFHRLQYSDPMAGRKEFLLSAVEMAREKPLLGHGLGTFAYGYPRFAQIDLPTSVNHAHNDWAEFAAEGGILFTLLLLLPLVGISRRILQNPWSIGCAVLAVHAVVDFPFARPGVVGWYFAILGMLYATSEEQPASKPVFRWVTSVAAMAGVAAAAWFGIAGVCSMLDTPISLAQATRMAPGDASYWLRHSQLTGNTASLEKALALNPLDSQILIEAGLRAEVRGDFDHALDLLQRAALCDRTWLPRWSLANFHFRRSDEAQFWKWARAAAATGSQRDFTSLFKLALEMDRDPESAAEKLLPKRPQVLREWIAYLLRNSSGKEVAGLKTPAHRLIESGTAMPDRNYVVAAVERFLEAKQPVPAGELWKGMVQTGWLPATIGQSFVANPLGEGFDWRMSPAEGVIVSPHVGTWTISFSGKQPEFWAALHRLAEVEPAQRYRLRVEYETEGVPAASGLRWRVLDEMSGRELARSGPLAASPKKEAFVDFQSANPLVRIQLFCEREQGYGRVNGAIHVSAAELIRVI